MRTVTVTGHGSAPAVPDAAVVRVSAVHRASALADALSGVGSAGDMVGAVGRRHVAASAISTFELAVWPSHDEEGRPSGFEARHSFRIECDSLDVAGVVIDELATAVGDRLLVEGVSPQLTDASAAEAAAREAAYGDARARAEHLAGLAGVVLGDVQSVDEGGGGGRVFSYSADAKRRHVTFEAGETSVSQSLTVTWSVL